MRLEVNANVEQLGLEVWRVSIRIQSGAGHSDRAITAHSCAALVDATSLIIAMLIDPETAATHARPIEGTTESSVTPSEAAAISAVASAPSSSVLPPAPQPASDLRMNPALRETKNPNSNPITGSPMPPFAVYQPMLDHVRRKGLIAAWADLDSGSLPSATEVFGGSLGLLYGRWRGETSFGYWLPKSTTWGGSLIPNAGGKFGKLAGSAKLCRALWAPTRFALSPCAGLELARLSGTGNTSLSQGNTANLLAASVDAEVLGTLGITDFLALR